MHTRPGTLSDEQLVGEIRELVSQEYRSLADLLSLLAEMDDRRLYAQLGFPSLFAFVVQELHLSEDAAYKRITAARAARRFPMILTLIGDGKIHLTTIMTLAPILTTENHETLLTRAVHQSKFEVERIKAAHAPRPDVPDMMRMLPDATRSGASSDQHDCEDAGETSPTTIACNAAVVPSSPPARRDAISPLSEQRVKIQFTGSHELRSKIERKAMRSASRLQPQMPDNTHSRYIPQHVKDAVWKRDQGRCQYVAADGKRCNAQGFLEFDHIEPFARGGSSDNPENIRLLCRAHNQLAMRAVFGELSRPESPASARGDEALFAGHS